MGKLRENTLTHPMYSPPENCQYFSESPRASKRRRGTKKHTVRRLRVERSVRFHSKTRRVGVAMMHMPIQKYVYGMIRYTTGIILIHNASKHSIVPVRTSLFTWSTPSFVASSKAESITTS
jgi:hypothetical protein